MLRLIVILFLVACTIQVNCQTNEDKRPQRYRAEPIGGKSELRDFIRREMVHPTTAPAKGKVKIGIALNEEGVVTNLWTIKSSSVHFELEAKRIVGKILWHPARMDKQPIPSVQNMVISFSRKRFSRWVVSRGYKDLPNLSAARDTSRVIMGRSDMGMTAKPFFKDPNETVTTFVTRELRYPETAKKFSIQGKVTISFVVEPSGNPSNFRIVKDLGGGCNEETIRLIKAMRWKPAMLHGKPTRSLAEFTMHFKLPNPNFGVFPAEQGIQR